MVSDFGCFVERGSQMLCSAGDSEPFLGGEGGGFHVVFGGGFGGSFGFEGWLGGGLKHIGRAWWMLCLAGVSEVLGAGLGSFGLPGVSEELPLGRRARGRPAGDEKTAPTHRSDSASSGRMLSGAQKAIATSGSTPLGGLIEKGGSVSVWGGGKGAALGTRDQGLLGQGVPPALHLPQSRYGLGIPEAPKSPVFKRQGRGGSPLEDHPVWQQRLCRGGGLEIGGVHAPAEGKGGHNGVGGWVVGQEVGWLGGWVGGWVIGWAGG